MIKLKCDQNLITFLWFTITRIPIRVLHKLLISSFSVVARTDRQTHTQTNKLKSNTYFTEHSLHQGRPWKSAKTHILIHTGRKNMRVLRRLEGIAPKSPKQTTTKWLKEKLLQTKMHAMCVHRIIISWVHVFTKWKKSQHWLQCRPMRGPYSTLWGAVQSRLWISYHHCRFCTIIRPCLLLRVSQHSRQLSAHEGKMYQETERCVHRSAL